jgi:hypothetical protein
MIVIRKRGQELLLAMGFCQLLADLSEFSKVMSYFLIIRNGTIQRTFRKLARLLFLRQKLCSHLQFNWSLHLPVPAWGNFFYTSLPPYHYSFQFPIRNFACHYQSSIRRIIFADQVGQFAYILIRAMFGLFFYDYDYKKRPIQNCSSRFITCIWFPIISEMLALMFKGIL